MLNLCKDLVQALPNVANDEQLQKMQENFKGELPNMQSLYVMTRTC